MCGSHYSCLIDLEIIQFNGELSKFQVTGHHKTRFNSLYLAVLVIIFITKLIYWGCVVMRAITLVQAMLDVKKLIIINHWCIVIGFATILQCMRVRGRRELCYHHDISHMSLIWQVWVLSIMNNLVISFCTTSKVKFELDSIEVINFSN
jgi:hypothetical protein